MNRLIPTSALYQSDKGSLMIEFIEGLCDIPEREWSPRERKFMNDAIDNGEIYAAEVTRTSTALVVSTDLGSPNNKIELWVPLRTDEKKALKILQQIAEELI